MKKGRILIVDDQEEILHSLSGILSDEGHEVVTAKDGQEALHIVQTDSPDLVFLDIWIPGIDGMQTLKAIKRLDASCPVVMMSGHGTIETAVKAIKLGATDYLEKPLNLEDVLGLVDKTLTARAASKASQSTNGTLRGRLIGTSKGSAKLRHELQAAAELPDSVWLFGEKGTGKEFAARIIHRLGGKERDKLVKIRCVDLTEENFDGVFLGRQGQELRQVIGKLEQSAEGTLLLIGLHRLKKPIQSRLAQLFKDWLSPHTAGTGVPRFRGRVLTTCPIDPETLVADDFSAELVEMLSHRVIRIPALRERPEDIPLFVDHFLGEASDEFERDILGTDEAAMDRLKDYPWPGNVKELKNLIEHVVMTAPGSHITVGDLLIPSAAGEDAPGNHPRIHISGNEAPQATGYGTVHYRQQKTLRGSAVMYGQGLHSGAKTGLTLSPLPPGSGILFGQITSSRTVPAVISNVESTELATCLRANGSSARTIEHLMAVFHVYGLTNVLVKISGEVPIMDGSALEFCELVESAEIISQDDVVEEITITEPIELPVPNDSPKSMRIEPAECFEVEYHLDYQPPIGQMHLTYRCDDPEDFKANIAPARTFGFVKDMRMLDQMGLATGGRLTNVILLDDQKVVNPPLRFPDEFVRHKILDIIGDFYLLGRPFRAKVVAKQTGHADNVAMLMLINERLRVL